MEAYITSGQQGRLPPRPNPISHLLRKKIGAFSGVSFFLPPLVWRFLVPLGALVRFGLASWELSVVMVASVVVGFD